MNVRSVFTLRSLLKLVMIKIVDPDRKGTTLSVGMLWGAMGCYGLLWVVEGPIEVGNVFYI